MPTILGPIVPAGSAYPAVDDGYVAGGFRSVATLAARDAIPASRRKAGMRVYVSETSGQYELSSDLATWRLSEALLTSPQVLSDAQKITGRHNLGASGVGDMAGCPWMEARAGSVPASAIGKPAAGSVWGMDGPVDSHTRIAGMNLGNQFRLQNSGTVTHVEFYVPSTLPADCEVWAHIWRREEDRWDLVGSSGNLRSLLNANGTVQKVALAYPIQYARIGDYTCPELRYVSGSWGAGFHVISTPKVYDLWTSQDMKLAYSPTIADGALWDSATTHPVGYSIPVTCYTAPPVWVVIGDSRIAGYPPTRALVSPTGQYAIHADIAYRLEQMLGLPCRNVGIEGNRTTHMVARFAADVLAAMPQGVIIAPGGYNDLYGGISEADYTTNVQTMMEAALADGCYVVVCSDMPFKDPAYPFATDTDIQNAAMDTRCLNVRNLCATYDPRRVLWVDLRRDLGQERPNTGGASWQSGNRWDLKELFWSSANDRLHMSSAGAEQMARTVAGAIRGWFRWMGARLPGASNGPVVYVANPNTESLVPQYPDLPCIALKAAGGEFKTWDVSEQEWV